uniref:KOW domain-containing protein n=1 Tax=Corethron hystrix TaxID=216773 RepID=A0A7S1BKL8_9STRA|mmetsp:Transcript_29895/g.68594  ORF Transcript_29895/g.68594 Transcript_29895/m.68594 type:complete len:156 (+) Transcript_29895:684-1151(+)
MQPESGKVVIVLAGRFAGRKAVVVKTLESDRSQTEGPRKKGQCTRVLIAGIARNPRKVTRAMSKKKVEKRSAMKPFVKFINVNHVFPTRYQVDMDLKKVVGEQALASTDGLRGDARVDAKKALKRVFEERYLNQKDVTSEKKAIGSNYFFKKLRF